MNILILNHYAGSPYHGMEYRPYYLAKEWIKLGHDVTIVAATYSHIRTNNTNYSKKITRETFDGIIYLWIKTRTYKSSGIKRFFNMLDYIKGIYLIIPKLIKEKFDVVIASSTYPLDNYPAYIIAKKSGAKYVYEVHDLWPLSPMEIGGYSKYHPFILNMQWAENFAYKHVDKVVSILPCAEAHMQKHGLLTGKFAHIPNGISLDELSKNEPLDENIRSLIPSDKFIVGYTGTFGVANSLNTLLEAAAILQKINKEIFFVLIGKGPEKDNLTGLQKKLALNNCLILDAIPKNKVQSAIALFSISAIAWNNTPSLYRFGISPNKLFDYMYAGKPIIQAVEAGNDLVREADCGITVAPQNPQAMVDAIIKLYNMPAEERKRLGENGRRYVIENHSYDVLGRHFLNIIFRIK
ncbi:MAG: glycosyltransferase family 4 protein [Tannerellaceae bacterium]|jgi:glycosyltransferase involved in cell wall biosynthesis|nr:glycosyltransferase family 4 protein [Tannerellaceae bacterium]